MKPAEALKRARNLISKPEMLYSEREGREIMQGLVAAIEKSRCYRRAIEKDQEVFVLSSGDLAAPVAIEAWCAEAKRLNANPVKVNEAASMAAFWRAIENRKIPD